jgi:multidrug efflux system membrane fusion protein
MDRKIWYAGSAIAALAIVVGAVLATSAPKAGNAAAKAPPAIPVEVAGVIAREVIAWDEFSGRLEAVERVDIRSRVAGTVQSVHFREGALVKQGELLITIDPAPYAAEVDRAEAQVVAAQARVTYASGELDRARVLLEERAIALRERDERSNGLREADANLRAAQAALQSTRLNLGYTQVRAPVSGRVGRLEITAGNLVAAGPGAPVLTTLVSVNPIYASFEADEQIVARALADLTGEGGERAQLDRVAVLMGTSATVDLPFRGRLQLVDNQVDAKSGTVRVRAVFDNRDGSLIPGQFARVRMAQPKTIAALLVTDRAVGTDQSKKFVMVVGDDNRTSYREVTLGSPAEGLRIVSAGLKPGERIVVNGLQRIRPGAVVAPRVVPMAVASSRP